MSTLSPMCPGRVLDKTLSSEGCSSSSEFSTRPDKGKYVHQRVSSSWSLSSCLQSLNSAAVCLDKNPTFIHRSACTHKPAMASKVWPRYRLYLCLCTLAPGGSCHSVTQSHCLGFSSGYISPYIPPLVIIHIQYDSNWGPFLKYFRITKIC